MNNLISVNIESLYINGSYIPVVCFSGENIPEVNGGKFFKDYFDLHSFNLTREENPNSNFNFRVTSLVPGSNDRIIDKFYNTNKFEFNPAGNLTAEQIQSRLVKILENGFTQGPSELPKIRAPKIYEFTTIQEFGKPYCYGDKFLEALLQVPYKYIPNEQRVLPLYVHQSFAAFRAGVPGSRTNPFKDLQLALDVADAMFANPNNHDIHVSIIIMSDIKEANRDSSFIDTPYIIKSNIRNLSIISDPDIPERTIRFNKHFEINCSTPDSCIYIGKNNLSLIREAQSTEPFFKFTGDLCNLFICVKFIRDLQSNSTFINTTNLIKFVLLYKSFRHYDDILNNISSVGKISIKSNNLNEPNSSNNINPNLSVTIANVLYAESVDDIWHIYAQPSHPSLTVPDIAEIYVESDYSTTDPTLSTIRIKGSLIDKLVIDNLKCNYNRGRVNDFNHTFGNYSDTYCVTSYKNVFVDYTLSTGYRSFHDVLVLGTGNNGNTTQV
jgi:hypothetical protein